MSASTDSARAPAALIRCARSRSAIPPSRSSAATTAPSICGRKRSSAIIRCASPIACIIGPRPSPIASSWRSATRRGGWRQITYAQLLTSAGTSPRRCWRAGCRPRSRSSFSPAIRSITRCSRSARSMPAFRSARCRRPIRWCRGITASSAYLMKLLTPGLVFADDADEIRRRAGRQCSCRHRDRGVARRSARPRRDHAAGSAGDAGASAPRCGRTRRSARTRSQNSC